MKTRKSLALLVLVFGIVLLAIAEDWKCSSCGQVFQFDPRDTAHRADFIARHTAVCGTRSGGTGTAGGALSPAIQALGNAIGKGIANLLFGDPSEEARLAEIQRQFKLEQARLAEESRQREIARQEMATRWHNKYMSEIMRLDGRGELQAMKLRENSGDLPIIKLDNDPAGLHPAGTAFFGIGGGGGKTVDLNKVEPSIRNACYWVAQAIIGSSSDSTLLMEEAIRVADGGTATIPVPTNVVPILSEDGLIAFQKANIDYRKARTDHADAGQELARAGWEDRIAQKAIQDLRASKGGTQNPSGSDFQRRIREAEAAAQSIRTAYEEAKKKVDILEILATWKNTLRRVALRTVVDQDPILGDMVAGDKDALNPALHRKMVDAFELYMTGSTAEEKIRGKIALEQAQKVVLEELRPVIAHWRAVQEQIRRSPETTAEVAERKAAEREADQILKKGFAPPDEMDPRLIYILNDVLFPAPNDNQSEIPEWQGRGSMGPGVGQRVEAREVLTKAILDRRREQAGLLPLWEDYDFTELISRFKFETRGKSKR
jgi:hypothetical protein